MLPQKCVICDKVNKYKNKKLLPLAKCDRKQEKTGKSIFQENIQSVATTVKDERMLRLCENYDFIAAEACYHKECYLQYMKQVEKTKVKEKTPYEIAEEEFIKYINEDILPKKQLTLMTELLSHFEVILNDKGMKIDKATKKKMRNRVKDEFSSSASIFENKDGRLIFLPNEISRQELAIKILDLQNELKLYKEEASINKFIDLTAEVLQQEIKSCKATFDWPPIIRDLEEDQTMLPTYLARFLNKLFKGGNSTQEIRINSIGQDILYIASRGRFLTAKHVLLPFTVKSLTGNVELIKILNRFGHGISYSKILEIETAMAITKLSSSTTLIPTGIQPNIPTTAVFDNIDRLEETLSGSGTTHRVNGILVQQAFIGPMKPPEYPKVEKTKRRSIEVPQLLLPTYNVGKRPEVPIIENLEKSVESKSMEGIKAMLSNFIWAVARYLNSEAQKISSWTGFNMLARKNHQVLQDTIGYLPTIDSPATEMNTVFEILKKADSYKNALNLKSMIIVMDQAIYAKAIEITWKHQDLFADIVLRLGTFHTSCVLMAVIGLRFGSAGLRDVIIESKVIAEGSVEKTLNGKHYNRAVRFHKLMFEACMRLVWESFVDWIKEKGEETEILDHAVEKIKALDDSDKMDDEIFQSVSTDNAVIQLFELFQKFCTMLRDDNGSLSQFWMSYIDLVTVLLNLIRAAREGNWILHLTAIEAMIPWCFAYNRINYSRYLPWYYKQMKSLEYSHPELHTYLVDGGFSCQIGKKNTFGRIPMDQTIEETINKDTQTAGGTKGFSTRANCVAKYYITANDRANYVRQLRAMIAKENFKFEHPDMTQGRIAKDEKDVVSLVNMLKETWKNPFELSSETLCCISTGVIPSDEAIQDMCKAREKGEAAYQKFVDERLEKRSKSFFSTISSLKLKTFQKKKVTTTTSTGKEVILKADKNLFSVMTLVAQSRQLNMKEVFSYPLGPIPWSLSTADGSLRKTSKAVLSKELEKLSVPVEVLPENVVTIIDAMSIVQRIKGASKTFRDIAKVIFNTILAEATSSRLDVVFDVYREQSIKNIERMKNRNATTALQFKQILPTHKIQQWQQFLKGSSNKKAFIQFLATEWRKEDYRTKLQEKTMMLAWDEECWRLTRNGSTKLEELCSNQEEADTRMFLHVKQAESHGHGSAVIISEDTDVFVLAVYIASFSSIEIYQKRGTQGKCRYVNISAISNLLGTCLSKCLLGLHAYTGCDTISSFSGKGKIKAWKLIQKEEKHRESFLSIGTCDRVSILNYVSSIVLYNIKMEVNKRYF